MPPLRVAGKTKYMLISTRLIPGSIWVFLICFSISVFEVWLPLEKNNIWLKKFNLIQENKNDSPAVWSHMDSLVGWTHLNRVCRQCLSVGCIFAIDWVQDDYFSAIGSLRYLRDVVDSFLSNQDGAREESLLIMTVCRALRRQSPAKDLLGLTSSLPHT